MKDFGLLPDDSVLARLIPLNALSPDHRSELARSARRVDLSPGERLQGGERDHRRALYLLEGELELLAADTVVDTVVGGAETARYALSQLRSSELTARARTPVRLLEIDASLLSTLLIWAQSAGLPEARPGAVRGNPPSDTGWMPRVLRSDLFTRIPPANVQRVLKRLEPLRMMAGKTVVRQGEPGDYYFVIREGRCQVTRTQAPGEPPTVLTELKPGDRFGEEALVSGAARNATVTMLTDGVLLRLTKDDFVELIKEPLVKSVTAAQARRLMEKGAVLLDARLPDEHKNDGLAGSINIPLAEIRSKAGRLQSNKTYIVYSNDVGRSSAGTFLLSERGLRACVLEGGLNRAAGPAQAGAAPSRHRAAEADRADSEATAGPAAGSPKKTKAAAELKAFLTRANAELETALRHKAEATMARRLTEQEAAALRAEAAKNPDDATSKRLSELRTRLKMLQLESNSAGRSLNQAQRKKLELELAIRSAEAETERERAIAEATCDQLRQRAQQRLKSEEKKLQAEYQRATSEMQKLRQSRAAAESRYQAQRDRLEADYAETRRQLEQDARRVKDEVKALESQGKARAAKIRAQQSAEEQKLRADMEARLRAKRERLEAEFARSVASLEKAQQELRRAEASKRAAHEEAKRLMTELRAAREKQRAQADARLVEETKRLERESSRAEKELAKARRLKEESEAARRAMEGELRATATAKTERKSGVAPLAESALQEKLEGIEARIADAEAQVKAAARAKTDAEKASREAEARVAEQRVAEDELRLQVSEEFEAMLRSERERSQIELTQARETVEEMGRAKTTEDEQASEAANAAMMEEISAQLGAGSGDLERALGAHAYAEEMAELTRSAHEAAMEERRKAKQALQRAREQVKKVKPKDFGRSD